MAEKSNGGESDEKQMKLIFLLAETSKTCLLKLLHYKLNERKKSLSAYVTKHLEDFKKMETRGIFTATEMQTLLGPFENLNNVRLIYLLVRYLTSSSNEAASKNVLCETITVPDDADFSISADLSRLSCFKNQIMNQSMSEVTDDNFEDLFNEIQEINIRILRNAYCSKGDINTLRKEVQDLKKSTFDDLKGRLLLNVMQCVNWSSRDFDAFQKRLQKTQIEMASTQVDTEPYSSDLQEDLSSLSRDLKTMSPALPDMRPHVAPSKNQDVHIEMERLRHQLATVYERMQMFGIHLLSKAPTEERSSLLRSVSEFFEKDQTEIIYRRSLSAQLDQNTRQKLMWEKYEKLGEYATIPPVLYTNMNHPNLKKEFPDSLERLGKVSEIWNQLPTEEKQPYLRQAKANLRFKMQLHDSANRHNEIHFNTVISNTDNPKSPLFRSIFLVPILILVCLM